MDPQQRILLETVYEGVESAGYSLQHLRGSLTGVFVGVMSFDYQFVAMRGIDSLPQYHATGAAMSILANRVSYFFDWKGPSIALDTACSSSLVAMHQAVLALRNGEVKMAVAAGANLILGPEPFITESKLNMLSPNGRSFMWDAAADGYTRGEGFSAIVLKTLSQAIRDGDHIESIIRETGVNSDGRTPGITMPSSDAQAALIRSTYARCGLDPTHERDRPQYFEAHGTGTQAGDPIEARAVQSVFFPSRINAKDGQLLVGSIKTVIGHTEGNAGLAGVLKASLAVQHGQIPANLHFKELNPKIRPYYSHLRIPTVRTPWPVLPEGCPRRVSVNSFGFGGTNAHAIIESWDSSPRGENKAHGGGLFVISANSSKALAARAASLATWLRENSDTDLAGLAYTLLQRPCFSYRAAFSATSSRQLANKFEASAEALKKSSRITPIPEMQPLRVLGVFTGQGAQWASMGRELYHVSDVFRNTMVQMQRSLEALPEEDRPDWSLIDEMCAPVETSRVGTASISQPLCTALQVALVNVLTGAGVELAAVVGHSSGEIAAAYAAGHVDAHDAVRIAYYRGFHSQLAQGPGGNRGKMMAVGMSMEQASRFCGEFGGALVIAASNSQRSCTLSGDAEAIEQARTKLQEDGIFARVLEIDTAYHSHHMQPCAAPYLESMVKCGIRAQRGSGTCAWYSSVWGSNGRSRSFNHGHDLLSLKGQYWVDNLTHTVQFYQALNRVLLEEHVFDLVLEIGPHPALKGPSSETIKTLTGLALPYAGVLRRGEGAVEAFSDALGAAWKLFPSLRPMVNRPPKPVILKGLPTYPWDHDDVIWHESRASRIFRTQSQPRHELLGHAMIHGERQRQEVHWRQVLKLSEIPWLHGHRIMDQCLFPITGYITMAHEAAIRLVTEDQALRLVELHDIEVHRPMNLEEESSGLEILFIMRITSQSSDCVEANFSCYSAPVDANRPEEPLPPGSAQLTGSVRLLLGNAEKGVLPPRAMPQLPLDRMDMTAFYASLSDLGYNYTGDFMAPAMMRRLRHAVVSLPCYATPTLTQAALHPASLDTAIHGIFAGVASPGDGSLRSVYLPMRIDCVRISMSAKPASVDLAADSFVDLFDAQTISGDVDVFNPIDGQTQVQVRGIHMAAVPGSQKRGKRLFASELWDRDVSCGINPKSHAVLSEERREISKHVSRTAFFYCRRLLSQIKPFEVMLMGKQRRDLMNWLRKDLVPKVEAGKHHEIHQDWMNDTEETLQSSQVNLSDAVDLALVHTMGRSLVQISRGMAKPLAVLSKDDMLNRMYSEGVGFRESNEDLSTLAKQLAHRYPRMKILELGASGGVTTLKVLASIADRYASYVCTDISPELLPRETLAGYPNSLTFSVVDIQKAPGTQGLSEASFDLIIASNTLYTTHTPEQALRNCRSLLRPGGYLLLEEVTRDYFPVHLIRSLLPGSWLSSEGLQGIIDIDGWDALLRKTGFSGVDTNTTQSFCSVILSQAVDDTVQFLREPLHDPLQLLPRLGDIIMVSGQANGAPEVALASEIQERLGAANQNQIALCTGLEGIQVPSGANVLLLSDLDGAIFDKMDEKRFAGLQEIVKNAGAILWVSSGATTGANAKATMAVGWGRSVRAERPDLKLQFMDVERPEAIHPAVLAKHFIQLICQDRPEFEEVLWTCEPELRLLDGALYIPRVRPLDELNRISNARTNDVTLSAVVQDTQTQTVIVDGRGVLVQTQVYPALNGEALGHHQICLQASASSFYAQRFQDGGSAHLVIGQDVSSAEKLLALSTTNGSRINVSEADILYRWSKEDVADDRAQLHLLLAALVAENILDSAHGPVWVHGVPMSLRRALKLVASQRDIGLFLSTSDAAERDDEIAFIHPYISGRDLRLAMPRDVKIFISFDHAHNDSLTTLVRVALPNLKVLGEPFGTAMPDTFTYGFSRATFNTLAKKHAGNNDLGTYFEDTCEHVIGIHEVSPARFENLGSVVDIIDWSAAQKVTAKVLPRRHDGLFSPEKTYILFGLSGDVGISICQWMVEHGARTVVLASRNPNVPQSVIEYMSCRGATVHAMAVDICDHVALQTAYEQIEAEMPAIGGMMNGAAAWHDGLLADLSWDDFAAVLAPKVQATQNLAQLLEQKNIELDFFVLFSSVVAIAGNAGQTAYAAANSFMEGFVRERQRRGLAASVVHIGHLAGLGYVHRHNRRTDLEHSLHQTMDAVSETDLHDLLAEAIIGGQPGSGQPAELIAGLKSGIQAPWRQQPRLEHYLISDEGPDEDSGEKTNGHVSIKAQLAASREDQETCLSILVAGFSLAVETILYMKPGEMDVRMSVANLGIDSLVAIRMREWFSQEIGVDVSVVKILSVNTSMLELCRDVLAMWRRANNKTKA
ncbi:hypothetical protein BDW02DRAFT_487984 [Decorospora gaudefroyi]|uniref:Polyketide synthase n=1 Tax=Decorospora gaudefroyi TaxID=184978 RepID=A0A6A5KUI4_9PLEO|nr:hypothetical protein BDW02DRAFT_487984 [Decorospora gaudefroyi]